jgi:hypothetical protein
MEDGSSLGGSMIALSESNSKLKKSNSSKTIMVNFTLPAGKTCPGRGLSKESPCSKCFAQRGFFMYPGPRAKHEANLELTKKPWFTAIIDSDLQQVRLKHLTKKIYCRIHVGGDFYSKKYLDKWCEIANLNQDVTFYAYTKSVHLFKARGPLPDNFIVRFSLGGKFDHMLDEQDKIVVVVDDKRKRTSSDNDLECIDNKLVLELTKK